MFKSLERRIIGGIAAAAAMHSLMERQQDLGYETSTALVQERAKQTAQVAVAFANAVVTQLLGNG